MTSEEHGELRLMADALEDSAARLPSTSQWRGRFLREAGLFRSMATLPAREADARSRVSGLRLIEGGGS